MYRCIEHRHNGIFKTTMATSHVSDKIADVPTKCRRQMMYLMFKMVHSNMYEFFFKYDFLDTNAHHMFTKIFNANKEPTYPLKKKLMFFRLKGLILVQVKQNAPKIAFVILF